MIRKIYLLIAMSGFLAASLVGLNFFFFRSSETLFPTINILAGLIFAFPIIMYKYTAFAKHKEMEDIFPVFLRDFVETIRGGMPVPQAIKALTRNDYKIMNPYVKKMAAQMDWGIPVEKVFLKFSEAAKSNLVGRIISSVIESHRFGGNLADTFEALSRTSFEVEKLRAERRLYLSSQMLTGYIIFFVFLAVIIGLGKFIIPTMTEGAAGMSLTSQPIQASAAEFKDIFRNLIIIQGLFAGLTVGKMAEGALIGGIKHSLIMILVGLVVFTIFA